jgi:hydroxyethylthiazole kinase
MFSSLANTNFKLSLDGLFHDLAQIRQTNPVIHNITNLVVMSITANLLLALGASPIMAHAQEEIAEIVALSQALVINIGSLDKDWVDAIAAAQKNALQIGIPIVFDPVGAGASRYRTETSKKILKRGVTIVRGNASEIMALHDTNIKTKGVDSTQTSDKALAAAKFLAQHYNCTVVVSGKTDWIVNTSDHIKLHYGTTLFTKVVGMGCSLNAIIASFLTVNSATFSAAAHALALFGLIGELAEQQSKGPGSFYTNLLDSFYTIKQTDLQPFITKPAFSL